MARISSTTFKEWKDGDVVGANDYMQELEILRAAINDNNDRVGILEGAASGTIKRIPSGTSFPSNPTAGDVFFRTDEGLLYVLGSDLQWRADSPKDVVDTHINSKENPHGVTAAQIGSYTKTEIDNKLALPATTAVTLQSGWVNYDAAMPSHVFKDASGMVHIFIFAKSGTTAFGTLLGTVPTGFRPSANRMLPASSASGTAYDPGLVSVGSDGSMYLQTSVNNVWLMIRTSYRP